MARFRSGDREAADQLFSVLYPELRRLAAIKMNAEGSENPWQPSLLVNELYLQLVKVKSLPAPELNTIDLALKKDRPPHGAAGAD